MGRISLRLQQIYTNAGHGIHSVRARRKIEQCPLSSAPAVPAGKSGTVEDIADDYVFVDFGAGYGVVLCLPEELKP